MTLFPGVGEGGIIISVWEELLLTLLSCTANVTSVVGKSCFLGTAPLWITSEEERLMALLLSGINSHKSTRVDICLSRAFPVLLSNSCFLHCSRLLGLCRGPGEIRVTHQRHDITDRSLLLTEKVTMRHCWYELQGHLCFFSFRLQMKLDYLKRQICTNTASSLQTHSDCAWTRFCWVSWVQPAAQLEPKICPLNLCSFHLPQETH